MTEMAGPFSTTPRDIVVTLVRWVKSMRELGCEAFMGEEDAKIDGRWLRKIVRSMDQQSFEWIVLLSYYRIEPRHDGILLMRDGLLRRLDGGISGQSLRTSIIPNSIGRSKNTSS